jgi:hypothetical protein
VASILAFISASMAFRNSMLSDGTVN